ncbi:TonB family protein [Bradyrhizobium diazoefficiens]|jgi:periplasmic protein TonB|uniref:Putative TonB protein n=1 Tax=Bradyrhizobium diazoefficiens SEMIA 5080 TaxID=754504 RepID=A0A837C351_9BRAD|nr:TonB family protein [Bradyrhizobium diazoefficiens]APO56017.1 energy transducer TonB [Bradyrhizobium diazoefficiens]KGJ63435.1 putative TonB protein [Bradyrhizobium diazoefficiens SEMIA 5080]KOY05526.1 energy transducer TonB [Bradyrhizobium diazoefficiens]MCD9291421.1 TonB family protein [Bradyrhizobium diazoefficiens]MCD9809675.1 TonB family protein [Bradyrhizobium diazoefficiens]
MAAHAFVLHEPLGEREGARWGVSGAVIVALHVAVALLAMSWLKSQPEQGVSLPAIMVDMAPVTSAPQSMPDDVAPGPVMQEADASPPEPAQRQAVEETIAPTPPQDKPDVVAPPEQKLEPTPARPEPAKIVPVEKPVPEKPKIVRRESKKPSEAMPAPRTSAPPRAEREAPMASAMSAGAVASAIASYNQRVRAHLMRFHQYPSGGGGQRGVARLSFTLGRSGQVTSSRLGGSSGVAAFDAQAMSMIRQASPFPPFPDEIKNGAMSFSIPVEFTVR